MKRHFQANRLRIKNGFTTIDKLKVREYKTRKPIKTKMLLTNLNLRMEFPDFEIIVGKATLIYLMFQKRLVIIKTKSCSFKITFGPWYFIIAIRNSSTKENTKLKHSWSLFRVSFLVVSFAHTWAVYNRLSKQENNLRTLILMVLFYLECTSQNFQL